MEVKVLENLTGAIDENLPTILIVGGIVTGLTTIGYSVYAGSKIKEVKSDEKLSKKEKAIKIAKLSFPIVAGAGLMTACDILAHKKYEAKYGELLALYGVAKFDGKKLKEEASKILGEPDKKVEKKLQDIPEPINRTIEMKDLVTGYRFKTTMQDFWDAVNVVNSMAGAETVDMGIFYENLLGNQYECADAHENIKFGIYCDTTSLRPEFGSELDENLKPIYTITYDHD